MSKKSGRAIGYQYRKKGRTSNVLNLADGKGIPIALGSILIGNHNDLYQLVPQFSVMLNELKQKGISVENSILNADKGFDSKRFRRCCMRRKIIPKIKENSRIERKKSEGVKDNLYKKYTIEDLLMSVVLLGLTALKHY